MGIKMLDEQGRPVDNPGPREDEDEPTEHMFTPWQARVLNGMVRTLRERADLRAILHCIGISWGLRVVVDALHSRECYW